MQVSKKFCHFFPLGPVVQGGHAGAARFMWDSELIAEAFQAPDL